MSRMTSQHALLGLLALATGASAQEARPTTYAEHVQPILEQSCTYCHDAADPSGGYPSRTGEQPQAGEYEQPSEYGAREYRSYRRGEYRNADVPGA